jgi:head-tail adaptor
MPGSGAKTERIAVERYTTVPDGGGGRPRTWSQIGELWAHAQRIGGGESDRQGALRAMERYRFTVLTAAIEAIGLTTEDRIVWQGEPYNIRERPRRLPRSPETEIVAETGVTQ